MYNGCLTKMYRFSQTISKTDSPKPAVGAFYTTVPLSSHKELPQHDPKKETHQEYADRCVAWTKDRIKNNLPHHLPYADLDKALKHPNFKAPRGYKPERQIPAHLKDENGFNRQLQFKSAKANSVSNAVSSSKNKT